MHILKRIQRKFWRILANYKHRYTEKYARLIGVKIGNNNRFTGVPDFGTEPWLVELGSECLITQNVRFHTHDGSVNMVRRLDEKYKDLMKFGRIIVGDRVFIGANVQIMPSIHIGSCAVIAAGSCVTKDIPSGEVWGGVPAKKICTLQEYADKCLEIGTGYLDNDKLLKMDKKAISMLVAEVYWKNNH